MSSTERLIVAALQRRAENGGRHLHHCECIHNLTPGQQVEVRGKTVEWWQRIVGPLPRQITPDEWETEPLSDSAASFTEKPGEPE